MSNKETKVPSLPSPGQDPDGFLRAVNEIVGVREGARGHPLDRGVTFRDLVDAGLAAPNPAISGKGRIPASQLIRPGAAGGAIGTGVKPTLTTPPTPQGVAAVGTFTTVLVTWASPNYANHAHAEILRADTNDIGQAVVIGSSVGTQYADAVGEQSDKYYWVRFVSTQGVKGMASPGVQGKTALSPELVMANLLATTWAPNTNYSLFQYVQPTTPNGMLYRVSQEGMSGATEPAWPTVAGQTRTDGTVRWTAASADERVPFIIGTVNGQPAVVMDTAYIGDATITTAKIKEAFLDNLTAIHGTLNFARIEQGNIFELTIGGDIKSETFSPFNNTGFIIRNEPGRDAQTPGIREYVAEFYGDSMFSGDIRAARVMGGIIVGSVFGVPSDTDNGAFEFIAIRDVVSSSVSGFRSDWYFPDTVSMYGSHSGVAWSGSYWVSNTTNIGWLSPLYHQLPTAGHDAPAGSSYYAAGPSGHRSINNLDAKRPPVGVPWRRSRTRTNPLSIISASAIDPFNYNRYRHANVTARFTVTRNSDLGLSYGLLGGQTGTVLAFRFYAGSTSTLIYEHIVSFMYFTNTNSSTIAFVSSLPGGESLCQVSSARANGSLVFFMQDVGGFDRRLIFKPGSYIDFNFPFISSHPEGLSLEIEVLPVSAGNPGEFSGSPGPIQFLGQTAPVGMDLGFTLSSAMDNNV